MAGISDVSPSGPILLCPRRETCGRRKTVVRAGRGGRFLPLPVGEGRGEGTQLLHDTTCLHHRQDGQKDRVSVLQVLMFSSTRCIQVKDLVDGVVQRELDIWPQPPATEVFSGFFATSRNTPLS